MKPLQDFFQKPWLYLVLVLLGFILKFYRIEHRYFWRDEISTIEHTSGNQILDIPENEINNISYYTDQLHLRNMDLPIGSELKGLFSSTNLNPMHYPFLMIWYRLAGDDPMGYRYSNIFILLLLLPVLFLLTKSLFKSNLAGWIAISLFVFSPLCQFYTQQARYNLFGIFLIVLLHYAFLQVISTRKIKWWVGYTIVGILSLYASFLSGLMIFGHALYILFFEKKIRAVYSISLVIVIVAYIPWIHSLVTAREEISGSLAWHTFFGSTGNPLKLLLYQLMGFNRFFNFTFAVPRPAQINFEFTGYVGYLVADLALLIIVITCIVYTILKAPGRITYFLGFIVLPLILLFLVSDLARKTLASAFWRYQLINYVGLMMFLVFFIQRKTSQGKLYASGIYAFIILFGLFSIFTNSKGRNYAMSEPKIKTAEIISADEKSLIISDYPYSMGIGLRSFTAILYECSSEKIDILRASADIEDVEELLIDSNYSAIYVLQSSDGLVQNLKHQFGNKIDSLEIDGMLPGWQIDLNKE